MISFNLFIEEYIVPLEILYGIYRDNIAPELVVKYFDEFARFVYVNSYE